MHYLIEGHLNVVKFAPYIFLISIVIFLGIGWFFGKYRLRTSQKVVVRDSLAAAIFGLSALVLGFTFSSAIVTSIARASGVNKDLADKILGPQTEHLFEVFKSGILNARHHPPVIIERFLFALLTIGALLSGYAMAVQKEEDWFLTIICLGIMGLALYVIFSLEFPNELFPYESMNADFLCVQKLLQ